MPDVDSNLELILAAVRNAQAELRAHLKPPGRPPEETIDQLFAILDDEALIAAQAAVDPGAAKP